MKFQIHQEFKALQWYLVDIHPLRTGFYQVSDQPISGLIENIDPKIDEYIDLANWDGEKWSGFESEIVCWRGIKFDARYHLLNSTFSGTLGLINEAGYEADRYEISRFIIRDTEISLELKWISQNPHPRLANGPVIAKLQLDGSYLVSGMTFSSHGVKSTDKRSLRFKILYGDESEIFVAMTESGWEDEWEYEGELICVNRK